MANKSQSKEESAERRANYQKRLRTNKDSPNSSLLKIGLPILVLLIIVMAILFFSRQNNQPSAVVSLTPTRVAVPTKVVGVNVATPDFSQLNPPSNSHLLPTVVATDCISLASATGPTPVTAPRVEPTTAGTAAAGNADDQPFTMDDEAGAQRLCTYYFPHLYIRAQKVEISDARATGGKRDVSVTFIPQSDAAMQDQDIDNIATLVAALNATQLKVGLDTLTYIKIDASGKVTSKLRTSMANIEAMTSAKINKDEFIKKLEIVP